MSEEDAVPVSTSRSWTVGWRSMLTRACAWGVTSDRKLRTVDVLRRGGDGDTGTSAAGSEAKCACLRGEGEYFSLHDEGEAAGAGVVLERARSANGSDVSLGVPRDVKKDVRLGLRACTFALNSCGRAGELGADFPPA